MDDALVPLDSLTVDVLSDNVSDTYVSKTPFARAELANVVGAGATVVSGQNLLLANLGYGLRLTSTVGSVEHVMLFDTGPEGAVFMRNCTNLGIGLDDIEEIAISHGHWDHMGALLDAIDRIVARRGSVAVHVNPLMFRERAVTLTGGEVIPTEKVPAPDEMCAHGAVVINDERERNLLGCHFYYSGEILRLSSFETGRPDHLCRQTESCDGQADWGPDPLLMDERMLVAHVRGLGLIVFSACSHAGIVNVCTEVARRFPDVPIHAVMRGLHLGGVMERIIDETVAGLAAFQIRHIIAGHCTGWRAVHALADAFGNRVSQWRSVRAIGSRLRRNPERGARPGTLVLYEVKIGTRRGTIRRRRAGHRGLGGVDGACQRGSGRDAGTAPGTATVGVAVARGIAVPGCVSGTERVAVAGSVAITRRVAVTGRTAPTRAKDQHR